MPTRRVMVTGGAGFIGSHLVEALLARGDQVVIYDDLSMGRRENVPEQAQLVIGDIRDHQRVAAHLKGIDLVYHLAARVSIRDTTEKFVEDAEINLMGTLGLLRACGAAKPKRFVMASSMAVYADSPTPAPVAEGYPTQPISGYGISKLASERYCLQLCPQMGVQPMVLRFFNTYGTRQTYTPYVGVITIFTRKLLAGQAPTIFGDGEQCRDFTHVSDIVQGCLLAGQADTAERVFNIGSGRASSVNQVTELLIRRIAPHVRPDFAPAQPGELRNCVADVARAARELGYQARCTLADRLGEVTDYIAATAAPESAKKPGKEDH